MLYFYKIIFLGLLLPSLEQLKNDRTEGSERGLQGLDLISGHCQGLSLHGALPGELEVAALILYLADKCFIMIRMISSTQPGETI